MAPKPRRPDLKISVNELNQDLIKTPKADKPVTSKKVKEQAPKAN